MDYGAVVRRKIFWTFDFFKGSPIHGHLKDIEYILSGTESGKRQQMTHLDNILEHAVNNSTFYKNYTERELVSFPVMNKSIYSAYYDAIKVHPSKIPLHKGEMHIQRTSGSSGTPFAVPQDHRKRIRRLAELKYFGEVAGYKSHEKLAQLRIWKGQAKSNFQIFKENIFPIECSKMDDQTLEELCDLINEKKISAILGYASWFDQLVKYLEAKPVKISTIKTIIACSEMLQEDTRQRVKELIGCEIVSRYSNEEQGILGQEMTSDPRFFLNHASYHFELLKLDSDEKSEHGELGRIVVTDLFNYAFPMIRYDTGDTGIMEDVNHLKGFPLLIKLWGRKSDIVYDTNGDPVHPMTLFRILKHYPEIKQWQFVQKSTKGYSLNIVGRLKSNINEVLSHVKSVFGPDAKLSIDYMDEIPLLTSGKRKPVVCELDK